MTRPASIDDASRFRIVGRAVRARIRTPALAAWLERHWCAAQRDGVDDGDAAADPHPYRIALEERATAPPEPAGARGTAAAVEVELPDGVALVWRRCAGGDSAGSDRHWITGDAHAGVSVRLGPGRARIVVWGAAEPSPELYPALYVAVTEALRASGLVPLHAAVIVRSGLGEATALMAASGIGKTTTLLRLLDRGWRPLAEDLAWYDPATGRVHAGDRGIRLWPDAIERAAPRLATAAWSADRDGKAFLSWEALGVERVPSARLVRLVVLERDGAAGADAAASAIGPLPRHEAVRALWEASGVPLAAGTRQAQAGALAGLARDLTFARLRIARPPVPDPDTGVGRAG